MRRARQSTQSLSQSGNQSSIVFRIDTESERQTERGSLLGGVRWQRCPRCSSATGRTILFSSMDTNGGTVHFCLRCWFDIETEQREAVQMAMRRNSNRMLKVAVGTSARGGNPIGVNSLPSPATLEGRRVSKLHVQKSFGCVVWRSPTCNSGSRSNLRFMDAVLLSLLLTSGASTCSTSSVATVSGDVALAVRFAALLSLPSCAGTDLPPERIFLTATNGSTTTDFDTLLCGDFRPFCQNNSCDNAEVPVGMWFYACYILGDRWLLSRGLIRYHDLLPIEFGSGIDRVPDSVAEAIAAYLSRSTARARQYDDGTVSQKLRKFREDLLAATSSR